MLKNLAAAMSAVVMTAAKSNQLPATHAQQAEPTRTPDNSKAFAHAA
jgi:hypothetical protein